MVILRTLRTALTVGVVLFLAAGCSSRESPRLDVAQLTSAPYDFPLTNPYAATVVTTPLRFLAPLPQKVPSQVVDVDLFPDRKVPSAFWFNRRLKFSLIRQKARAPLIFLIAGAGGNHRSRTVRMLQAIFYAGGYHVLTLPSPTHPNFIVSASSTGVTGRASRDVPDLYRAMGAAYNAVKDRFEVSGFYLAGYSLGALHSAFLAQMDAEHRQFGFSRVLMINPPVSLYNSMRILDAMAATNIPGGLDNFNAFFQKAVEGFAEAYKRTEGVDFGRDFLYRIYKARRPPNRNLAALIGIAFTISAADMILSADAMSRSGLVIPPRVDIGITTSLTDYFKVAVRIGYAGYVDELLLPYYQKAEPGLTKGKLIAESSLSSIENYLRGAKHIRLITNADDFILAPGELGYLQRIFGDRAMVFPTGGHGGNLGHRRVVGEILRALR